MNPPNRLPPRDLPRRDPARGVWPRLWPLALAGAAAWGTLRWLHFAQITPGIDAQTRARLAPRNIS